MITTFLKENTQETSYLLSLVPVSDNLSNFTLDMKAKHNFAID